MPQPNVRDLAVAGPLQNLSIAYRNRSYVADRVFPMVENVPGDAKIGRFLKGAWFRDEAGMRGPGARAVRGGYPMDMLDVSLSEYAFAKEVTDEDRRMSRLANTPALSPDQDAIEFCADKIDLRKERLVAAAVLAGTWSGLAGEDAEGGWAAGEGNTFITDVETRIETIRANSGIRPNVLLICASTLGQVKQESTLLDRIKYTERGVVTPDLIASLFGLDEVLVGDAIYSTAAEAADGSDFSGANVWEKNAGKGSAFLFHRPERPGLKVPASGVQCRGAYEDAQARRVSRWREAAEHQDVYEVAEQVDIVVTGPDLGFLWYDTVAT